jgi:SAM-dependent methyltransferase
MSGHAARPYEGRAELYAAHRWDYARDAVQFVLAATDLGADSCVADLGSGTGMLARHLVPHAGAVCGIEPDPDMRRVAEDALGCTSSFRSIAASAEDTGLPDGSIDLVTVGQALHWFGPDRARAEVLRILKPQGWLAVFWNRGHLADLSRAVEQLPGWRVPGCGRQRVEDLLPAYFGPNGYTRRHYRMRRCEDWQGFLGGLLSAAGAPREGDPAFPAFRDAAREVFSRFSVGGVLHVDVVTEVALGRRACRDASAFRDAPSGA